MSRKISEGSPEVVGVTPDARGVNVAVFSANATAVEFCLFEGEREIERIPLPERSGDIFHGHIADLVPGARYGLRAHGPFAPEAGHRFNAAKLLVDPYAKLVDRPFRLHRSMFPYPQGGDHLGFDATDSGPHMPKAVVVAADAALGGHTPLTPWPDTILYELHVRGFTKRHPGVPAEMQGTFAGLSHPAAIDHLVKLGITSVELLPTAAWIEERHLAKLGLSNYWGYNPVTLMAPEPRLAPGGWDEVRRAVAALAESGIETILDVVFNHTGEGDALGPTLSLRGLDNASYYRLHPKDPRRYIDDSGCGNTLALDRTPVVRLAMDSMRTWVRRAGIHGFRFDLAASIGRRPGGFDPEGPLLAAIAQDPELSGLKLIAEPWDIGPGGYQLGRFPAGWGEWNDRFRDDVRRFWRGDPHQLGALGSRLAGSADLFGGRRRPSRSINFITAHDGFSLADLVAHETKRNQANGEDNRDGCNANFSWNCGAEGASEEPAIQETRLRDQKALLATLLLARGTPMLSMGAESGHSQSGNNNCYAQDNETGWLGWNKAEQGLVAFTARLTALRRKLGALRSDRPLSGAPGPGGLPDVQWLHPDGRRMEPGDWDEPEGCSLLMLLGGDGGRVGVILHRGRSGRRFVLPQPQSGKGWTLLLDSASGEDERPIEGGEIEAQPRSVLLVAEQDRPERARGASGHALERLADAAGIQREWWSVGGERHEVSEDTKRALLSAMRLPASSDAETRASLAHLADQRSRRALPAALVVREGEAGELVLSLEQGLRRPVWINIQDEKGEVTQLLASPDLTVRETVGVDGRRVEHWLLPLPRLPIGHYRVTREDRPDEPCMLTVAPGRAWLPERVRRGEKLFGIAAQLYSLRRTGDQGIGDFTTLAELGRLSAAAGADLVGINPLHALFPERRERASPYYPSDRRSLEPLYLDLAALAQMPGGEALRAYLAEHGAAIEALSSSKLVDYSRVWALKEAGLRALFDAQEGSAELDSFIAAGGQKLECFAAFSALSAQHRTSWHDWPAELRDPASAAVASFAREHQRELRFHAFLQWLCERKLKRACDSMAGMEIGLYADLAVGAAPDGAEAWASQHLLGEGASIGAPPDPFAADGQVWGLPPPVPHALTASGYRGFAELLQANMAHAGALRIDHAMGLSRLFWVPEGAGGSDGAYVSYPFADLLGHVTLASARARCMVVAEDLGTVPEGFREAISAADVLRYKVMLLDREGRCFAPPSSYPHLSLACVTNHDLPTLAGWWKGADIEEELELGRRDNAEVAITERALEREELAREVGDGNLSEAVHRRLALGGSGIVTVQAEDLAGEESAVNVPGTDTERPNWRRKLAKPVDELMRESAALLAEVRSARDS
jgi:glycogen operon protein